MCSFKICALFLVVNINSINPYSLSLSQSVTQSVTVCDINLHIIWNKSEHVVPKKPTFLYSLYGLFSLFRLYRTTLFATREFLILSESYRENCGAISVIPVYRSLTLIIRTISRTSDYRKQITDQDHNSDSLRQAKSFPTVRFPSKMMACHGTKNDYLENIHFLDWWIGWVQLVRGQNVVLLKQIDHLSHHNTGG